MTDKKPSDPAEGDLIRKDALDAELRRYFEAERSRVRVPGFESVLASAERARREPGRAESNRETGPDIAGRGLPAWRSLAAVAAALVLVVLLRPWSPGSDEPMRAASAGDELPAALMLDQAELLADLNRSTLWVAPSDRWIETDMAPDVLGLPRMGKMTYEMQEVKSWL